MEQSMHGQTRKALARRLNAAADILETRGWCRHSSAVDKSGVEIPADSPEAVSFCAVGSIQRALFEIDGLRYKDLMGGTKRELVGRYHHLTGLVEEALTERTDGDGWCSTVEYNDEVVRNRTPIIVLLRAAAQRVLDPEKVPA